VKAIELFAGAGGLGLGISAAGFLPERIVEWDKWCCDSLRSNRARVASMKNWPEPIEGDVRRVDFRDLEGKVTLVSGGPPCQPFSLGGKHKAHGDSRDMWPEAVRAVREIQPKAFIFENVKGLTRTTFINYFEYIKLQLTYPSIAPRDDEDWSEHLARLERHHLSGSVSDLHYRVAAEVLDAADYGVPQRRHRVVFVGFRSDQAAEWSFPKPTHSAQRLWWDQARGDYWDRHRVPSRNRTMDARTHVNAMSALVPPPLKPWRTVRDATADLPDPQTQSELAAGFDGHRFQPGARAYPGHTGSLLDAPAKALKAGVHGVPGGENMLVREDGTVRYFTVRESARLQVFPDEYQFRGAWSEAMRQLGNAVPTGLADVIGVSIAKRLRGGKTQ